MGIHLLQAALATIQAQADVIFVSFETVAKPLAVAAGLALVVERLTEVLKNVTDLAPTRDQAPALVRPSKLRDGALAVGRLEARAKEEEIRSEIAKIEANLITANPAQREGLLQEHRTLREQLPDGDTLEVPEQHRLETLLVKDATDADDGSTLRALVLQLVAIIVGIVAARLAGLELFKPLASVAHMKPPNVAVDHLLSGLLIAGGSAPVHMLIRFIGERKVTLPEPVAQPTPLPAPVEPRVTVTAARAAPSPVEVGPVAAPPTGTAELDWIDVPYDGGVDRERLDAVHRRPRNPDLIIFHHTAMPLKSTFDDVVRVIRERTDAHGNHWLTGYHCVVTWDGIPHAFCRWDRYGNHAVGHNATSLGISLNGNFETDPSVPFSNPDGRYGPPEPTPKQLEAAARVVALWTHVYDIPVEFKDHIIPHKQVSPKTCPGNQFPYPEFETLVKHFHDILATPAGRARVDAFKCKPFLFV